MKLKCAVIDDHKGNGEMLEYVACMAGFESEKFINAETFLKENNFSFDCYLVDWHLPEMSGDELVSHIRKHNKLASVILVTGDKDIPELKALHTGADDFYHKPFDFKTLIAKLENVHAKCTALAINNLKLGVKFIDEANILSVDGRKISLTGTELKLAKILYKNRGVNVTRGFLESELNLDPSSRSLEVYIHSIRKKTQNTSIEIKSSRGVGYRWVANLAGN